MKVAKLNTMTLYNNIDKIFKEIESNKNKKVKEASEVIAEEVRSEIINNNLDHTGNLLKGVKTQKFGKNYYIVKMAPPAYHAFIVEYGSYLTSKRETKKGYSRGAMPPRPFFLPAFRKSQDKAIKILTSGLL